MDRSASAAVCVGVAIEIEEDTPREASQAKNEAEYNESTVTESEGTISQLHQSIEWRTNLRKTQVLQIAIKYKDEYGISV